MKVLLWPTFGEERGQGGIKRVLEALTRWLPEYGVELVDDARQADLINVHADTYTTDLPLAVSSHGLYWSGYDWDAWCYEVNHRLIGIAKQAQSLSVPSYWVHNAFARGMLLDPFVLQHGVELNDWHPDTNEGFIFWAKNRPDPICDPSPLNALARRRPQQQFVTTFGDVLPNIRRLGRIDFLSAKYHMERAAVYLGTVQETGGITCLEAMACGVPILGYDWGANQELVVHEETGYLVPPHDLEALEEGLDYCLTHRKRLGEAGRQLVAEKFQWKDRIRDYIPFYQAALDAETRFKVHVSIIVTAYKLEEYLPACLDSILEQDYADWECIVVDDASPDRCGEIAEDYAKRDKRFRVLHNAANRYLAEARNIGIRAARGKYVLALDADDALPGTAVGLLARALDKDRVIDIVTGNFELIEPDGRHWFSGWPTSNPNYDEQREKRNQVPYSSMYRRVFWERTGGYRRRCHTAEDAENWMRQMSYGARPAKVTDAITLLYNNRPNSMSHTIPNPDWTVWFPWSRIKTMTPFGAAAASDDKFYPANVHNYGPPLVSVVIPCGPGHDFYLQDALDSVVAQTLLDWECIVVNDTGRSWYNDQGKLVNPYLAGFPFITIVEPSDHKNRGVSWARNAGIKEAKAPVFVLLDADDYMQPLMLDVLYKVYRQHGGWVYSDWYDQDGQAKQAQAWSADGLWEKMLGPSTGLYSKTDWERVGGFDEGTRGWEDWSYQLALLEEGICGTKVDMPLFTYRYQTGQRREENFTRQKEIVHYIRDRHKSLGNEDIMAGCRSCGGGGGQASVSIGMSSGQPTGEMALIEYIGEPTQFMSLRSKVNSLRTYRFGGDKNTPTRRFYVYAGDVEWLTSMPSRFRLVELPGTTVKLDAPLPMLGAVTRPPSPDDQPINSLTVSGETVAALEKAGIVTVGQLRRLTLTDLMAIRGLGPTRARKVQDALAAFA